MDPTAPTVDSLLSVAGASAILTLVLELAFRTWKPEPATLDRFGPVIAAVAGIVLVGGAALYLHADVAQAVLTGLFAGFASSGIHDVVSSQAP